jgi:hypothetical protein
MFLPAAFTGKALTYSLFGLFTVHPPPASADTTPAENTARDTVFNTTRAGSPIDTGDFFPGRTHFTRYNTPQLCVGAVQNERWLAQRSIEAQVAVKAVERVHGRDTLPAAVIDVARRCLASLSVDATLPADLPDLLQLAVAANQDSVATAVIARHLSLVSNPVARDSVLRVAIEIYLSAVPVRLSEAAALVDRVAEPGEAGKRWQIDVLDNMLYTAMQAWDQPAMVQFANRMIDNIHALPPRRRAKLTRPMFDAYRALGMVAYLQGPDSLRAVAARERTLWHEFVAPFDSVDRDMMQWDVAQSASVDDFVQKLSPIPAQESAATSVYPAVQAAYWFPKPPPSGTTRLFISAEVPTGLSDACKISELALLIGPADDCYPYYERIRTLAARYGARGLQIVLLAATSGQAIRSLPLTPAEEAQRLKWYYLDYLKLPVTLGVIERPVSALPAPDGRQWRPRICDPEDPDADMSVTACKYLRFDQVLLDRHGKEVRLWGPDAQRDHIIEQQVSQ